MSRSVELSDEDYARLKEVAAAEVHESLGGCLEAGHRAGQIGIVDPSVAKPVTMAERLAGRIGTLSGSGGQPSSDNVAQSFVAHLEAKQREGRL